MMTKEYARKWRQSHKQYSRDYMKRWREQHTGWVVILGITVQWRYLAGPLHKGEA